MEKNNQDINIEGEIMNTNISWFKKQKEKVWELIPCS